MSNHPRGWAQIEGDQIVIRIPVGCLKQAWESSRYVEDVEANGWFVPHVTDETEFARSVTYHLNQEEEDGSTPITDLLDKTMVTACEDGCDGLAHD